MNKTAKFLLLATGTLLLAGPASAQGLGVGGLGGGAGLGAGGGVGIGAGRLGGEAGMITRGDAAINNRASTHAAEQAGAGADVHSPIGSTVHGNAQVSGDVDSPGVTSSNRQGPAHAADRAVANANANAGLATQTTTPNPLAGLATGLVVKDSTGATLGKVSRIQRSSDGTVRNVLVAGAEGERRTIRLAPDSLSVSGGVVTTTHVNH